MASKRKKPPKIVMLGLPPRSEVEHLINPPHSLRQVPYSPNPCHGCAGTCCGYTTHLTIHEAHRIAFTLGVDLLDAVAAAPLVPAHINFHAPEAFLIDGVEHRFEMKRSVETRKCVFVVNVGGRGICGIYGIRPHICALYPFHFTVDGQLRKVGNQEACPTRWIHREGMEEDVGARAVMFDEDTARDKALVKAWHARDSKDWGLVAFVNFSRRVVAENLGWPAVPDVPEPRRRLGAPLW